MKNNYELIHGDAGESLKLWKGAQIDVCVTSPTYWNEKSVARSGELGREARVSDYADRLVKVFANLRPKMKASGSLWLVLGDDYRNKLHGVPKLVAKGLVEDGWHLQRVYAWDKGDCRVVKASMTLDPKRSRDYVMQFTQGTDYYLAKEEPYADILGIGAPHNYTGSDTLAFPMQLVQPLIEATCPIGGTVVDPFVGTGTTVLAAVQARRKGVGIDLSEQELNIARGRLGGGYKIMKSKDLASDDRSKALRLADRGLYLWGLLLTKAENDDIENPDSGDEGDFLALPEVPAEDSLPSKQKVFEALTQVAQMLGEVLRDPDLAGQLAREEGERLEAIQGWLANAGKPVQKPVQRPRPAAIDRPGPGGEPQQQSGNDEGRGMMMMKMARDVNLSVKAVVQNPSGHLVLKDANSDWWDLPGGHVSEGETLDRALAREIKEETDLDLVKAEMRGVHALKLGDSIRPVVVYDAMVKGRVRLSEEHTGYAWANKAELERDSFNLGVFKQFFITDPAVAANRAGNGVNATPAREMVDNENNEMQVAGKMEKQGPPGPPPRPGLKWDGQKHRWVRATPFGPGRMGELAGGDQSNPAEAGAYAAYQDDDEYQARSTEAQMARGLEDDALDQAWLEAHQEAEGLRGMLPGLAEGPDKEETKEQLIAANRLEEAINAEADRRVSEVHGGRPMQKPRWRQGGKKALSKGSFGDPESALEAIRREHPDVRFVETKADGDQLAEDENTGESWYVTQDGAVYEYWHPEGDKEDKMGGFHAGASSVGFEPLGNAKKAKVTQDVFKRDENGFIVARMRVEE